jgi:cytoskeletal protein CcmA (bactofilin family)
MFWHHAGGRRWANMDGRFRSRHVHCKRNVWCWYGLYPSGERMDILDEARHELQLQLRCQFPDIAGRKPKHEPEGTCMSTEPFRTITKPKPCFHITSDIGQPESGAALLLFVLLVSIVSMLGAWGFLAYSRNAAESLPNAESANRARAVAMAGVDALSQYASQQYCGTAAQPLGVYPCKTGNIGNVNMDGAVVNQTLQGPLGGYVYANVVSQTNTTKGMQITLQSTGKYGGAVQTVRSIVTLQSASNPYGNMPYNIYVQGDAIFNGNVNLSGVAVGVSGTATVNGNVNIGRLDAANISANGGTTIGQVNASQSFRSNNGSYGQINIGTGGSFSQNATNYTPTYLTQSQTNALNYHLNDQAPVIDPQALKQYAGIRLLYETSGPVLGPVVTVEPWMAVFYPNLPIGTYSINSTQGQEISTQFTGQAYGFFYEQGGTPQTGTWLFNGGNNVNGFLYAEGDISFNGNSGTNGNPLYLTLVATGSVTFNGTADTLPWASYPGLCSTSPGDPVCQNGQPSVSLLGLSTVSGMDVNGSDQGIVYNGNSSVGGSIASTGTITVNGNSSINGNIVAENLGNSQNALELTFNGNAGTPVKDASLANYGGGSSTPMSFDVQWLRWIN